MFQLEDILKNAQKLERYGKDKKARHLYKRLMKKAPGSEIARISEERLAIISARQSIAEKQAPSLEWIAFYIMVFSLSGAFFITYPLSFVIQSSGAVLDLYIGLVCAAEITTIGLLMFNKLHYKKAFNRLSVITLAIAVLVIILGLAAVIMGH